MDSNLPISEQFRIIAKKWIEASKEANVLKETKSAVLAQKMVALGDMPVSKAEMIVKASHEWNDHVLEIAAAKNEADALELQLEYIRMKFSEWQSAEATRRAEMRL